MRKNKLGVAVPEAVLIESIQLVEWITNATHELDFTASLKARTAGACFAIVQDHHEAIVFLIERRSYTSAFALLRIAFDAYVRGVWLSLCATDREIEEFHASDERPNTGLLILAIEKEPDFVAGLLSDYKKRNWKALCDFTHTGYRQVDRWNTEDAIEPNYPINEVIEVLSASGLAAMMSVVSFAALVGHTDLALRTLEKLRTMNTAAESYDAGKYSQGDLGQK